MNAGRLPGFQLIRMILTPACILISFLISAISIYAQNITGAEYFFDTDPGVGNGIPITVPIPAETVTFSASISTAGLIRQTFALHQNKKRVAGMVVVRASRVFYRVGRRPGGVLY